MSTGRNQDSFTVTAMETNSRPTTVEFAAAIVEVHKILGKIEALCENPHWTAERRWRIADLSRKAQTVLEAGHNG